MQELDALKTRSKTGEKSKRVIRFLNSCFSARHPRVRGETLEEVGGRGEGWGSEGAQGDR